ncbi:MAG: ATP-binding cassette domain-containing protein, partial [Dolichospermum sp.]|nr:ATP-binding cassette domain-containing protein [Dolichospermum sp.]
MSIIIAENLNKSYPIAIKDPGIGGTIAHFFRRTYRNIKAVQDVSFTIEPGEIVGFLGPNGAGKTTTLKMLTGLIHPSSGTVKVGGFVPFNRQEAFLQKITLVMGQKQQLIWDLPALDSLRINAAVYNISDKEFQRRVGELTEMLALEGKLTQAVRKLSLGERMKAELLAALLHRPQVLFLDEPTLGLDINAQVAVRDFLREYNQLYQATILLTSHYMADITALCERV